MYIYMCVCMYICVYIYTCVCVCIYIHICMYVYVCMYVYPYICAYMYICMFLYMYVYMQVPCSRADVFNNTGLSLLEKRLLMKFLNFAADYEQHSGEFVGVYHSCVL